MSMLNTWRSTTRILSILVKHAWNALEMPFNDMYRGVGDKTPCRPLSMEECIPTDFLSFCLISGGVSVFAGNLLPSILSLLAASLAPHTTHHTHDTHTPHATHDTPHHRTRHTLHTTHRLGRLGRFGCQVMPWTPVTLWTPVTPWTQMGLWTLRTPRDALTAGDA